jgi:hypothetical protein
MFPDLADQKRKIGVQRGFSARQANPIHPTSEILEAMQNLVQGDRGVLLRLKDEGIVVTIRATEIAVRQEEHRADLPGPIDKRGFQESLDLDLHQSA